MSTNDWGSTPNDWSAGPTKQPTFRQDLGGFAFHLAMALLIPAALWTAWVTVAPQPTVVIELREAGQ